MSDKCSQTESPVAPLKSDAARQRWELFHRAIAHAKQSTTVALQDAETADESKAAGPVLTIVR